MSKTMKKIIFLLSLFTAVPIFSQEHKNHYKMVKDAMGDLNKDGLQDKVLLSMNTNDATQPLKLQIFFLGPDRKFKSAFTSTEIFDPQEGGDKIPDIRIENNNLVISRENYNDKNVQTFRHNKGKFELISIYKIKVNESDTVETTTDLLAGTHTELTKIAGSKKAKKNQKKITVNTLPTLDNIKSFKQEFE